MNRILPVLLFLSACHDPSFKEPTRNGPLGGGGGGGFCSGCGGDGGGGGIGGGGFFVDGGGTGSCGSGFENDPAVSPPVEPPSLIGGTMVALRSGGFAIGDADRGVVWLVAADLKSARHVDLTARDEPGRAVETPDGHVYVVLRRADQLAEIDALTGTLRRLDTCHLPRGLAVRGTQLIVACLGGELESIEPVSATRTPLAVNAALSDLRDVVVDGERLIVTQLRSAALSSIARDGTVTTLPTTLVPISQPHVAWRAVARPSGGAMVVRQQHRTRLPTSTVSCDAYGGGNFPGGDGGGTGGTGSVVQAEAVSISGSSTYTVPLGFSFSPIVLPVDVAVSASDRVAVLSAGTGSIALLSLGARLDVPLVAHGVDTQLTSVVFSGESAVVFVREPARVLEVSPDGVLTRTLDLAASSVASSGHELFHRATPAGIACASCHPEAGEDGHLWPFAEGARRTPTLRGGLGGTAPFHWSGELASMAALMNDVMVVRMNGPVLSDARMQAVETWLSAQPAIAAPVLDAATVARGRVIFESSEAACSSCHSGPKGTNNATVNVGTGTAFQVPRLAEFAWRAPWFHDGRMDTLEARFGSSSGGEAHGHTAQLSAAQRVDLMEYVRSR